MKRIIPLSAALFFLSGCSRLASIPYRPTRTPEQWLSMQPFARLSFGGRDLILVQPSSTVLVYGLGLVALAAGLTFLRIRGPHRSRAWWGIALLLWGLGALAAGTSYQAFSYQIKCAGREVCSWTSGWELAYLLLSAASVDAMMIAQAYACLTGTWRRALTLYALADLALYGLLVVVGALTLTPFLISFELLLIVAAPNVLLLILLNGRRYLLFRHPMDRALLGTWLWLVLTLAAYFIALVLGLTESLWQRGLWFSENDLLHLGLIAWMIFIALLVAPHIVDAREPSHERL